MRLAGNDRRPAFASGRSQDLHGRICKNCKGNNKTAIDRNKPSLFGGVYRKGGDRMKATDFYTVI
jgi:hypothetical protein